MKKRNIIIGFIICTLGLQAQEAKHIGPHGGEIIQLDDFQIEMVKENYRCLFHPEISGKKTDLCSQDGKNLERVKKIEFYLLDKNLKQLDVSHLEGRVIIFFNDETQSSKKIRINDKIIWVPLGNNGHSNYQQALIKFQLYDKKYKAVFGNPIIHKGHHH